MYGKSTGPAGAFVKNRVVTSDIFLSLNSDNCVITNSSNVTPSTALKSHTLLRYSSNIGGIVGYLNRTQIINCFYDKNTTGLSDSSGMPLSSACKCRIAFPNRALMTFEESIPAIITLISIFWFIPMLKQTQSCI